VLGRRAGGTPGPMPPAVSGKCGRSLADKIAKSRSVSRPGNPGGSGVTKGRRYQAMVRGYLRSSSHDDTARGNRRFKSKEGSDLVLAEATCKARVARRRSTAR
jgi:hypothetical protein